MEKDWSSHANAVSSQQLPAATTLQHALALTTVKDLPASLKNAIDLGSGGGTDTLALLQQGWQVTAVDQHAHLLEQLRIKAAPATVPQLQTMIQRFETLQLPPVTLINASFSLPFCHAASFDHLWQQIVASLPPGGIFAGHLFGIRDTWHTRPDMTFHTREQVLALLEPFDIKWLEETDKDGQTVTGESKHWHMFHITAVKKQIL